MEFKNKSHEGKYYRRKGKEHELRVRAALETEGWIVTKWLNNIDLKTEKIVKSAPNRFNFDPGFPDFLCFRKVDFFNGCPVYEVRLVECKLEGVALSKKEKEKIKILESKGFNVEVL